MPVSWTRLLPVLSRRPRGPSGDRAARARALLAAQGWDALLVASGAALGQRGNVRFLANYPTTTRYSALLFPARGDAMLFVPYPVHVYWAEGLCWTPQVRYTTDLAADVAARRP